jgi:hypothetical protein
MLLVLSRRLIQSLLCLHNLRFYFKLNNTEMTKVFLNVYDLNP